MSLRENIAPLLRKQGERPLIYGHRGASALEPENSMKAFERALGDGADGVELDVRMTSDGALVIAHDENLQFDQDSKKRSLGQLSFAELNRRTVRGQAVPTLTDVLAFQKSSDCLMNIELKGSVASPIRMARRAAEEIADHGGAHIVISSFDPRQISVTRRALPDVPTALLVEHSQWVMRRAISQTFLGASGIHPQGTIEMTPILARARKRVNVWTVNDPLEAQRLSEDGVDGLVSDNPGLLVRHFSSIGSP